ncbi:hypothetical protein BZG36_00567 [Bifiguratus adelaidae]|uniref:Uncharacterized protein n=1 Tax=Bifiguratus adelaidae TaxID=1938954 RepID=A0A261Y7F1_9FUNG|nr:hypothetical protein BZG36_00567 [Bifiguratus adelaidae]
MEDTSSKSRKRDSLEKMAKAPREYVRRLSLSRPKNDARDANKSVTPSDKAKSTDTNVASSNTDNLPSIVLSRMPSDLPLTDVNPNDVYQTSVLFEPKSEKSSSWSWFSTPKYAFNRIVSWWNELFSAASPPLATTVPSESTRRTSNEISPGLAGSPLARKGRRRSS